MNLPPSGGLLLTHRHSKHAKILGNTPLIRYISHLLANKLNTTCPPPAGDQGGGMSHPFAFTIPSMGAFPIIYKPVLQTVL